MAKKLLAFWYNGDHNAVDQLPGDSEQWICPGDPETTFERLESFLQDNHMDDAVHDVQFYVEVEEDNQFGIEVSDMEYEEHKVRKD